MRTFLIAVGILAWLMALSVLLVFAESGGAMVAIAAGVFAVVAVVALGCERIIRTLEEIRDQRRAFAPNVGASAVVLEPSVPGSRVRATVS